MYQAWLANRIDCKSKKNLEIFGNKKGDCQYQINTA